MTRFYEGKAGWGQALNSLGGVIQCNNVCLNCVNKKDASLDLLVCRENKYPHFWEGLFFSDRRTLLKRSRAQFQSLWLFVFFYIYIKEFCLRFEDNIFTHRYLKRKIKLEKFCVFKSSKKTARYIARTSLESPKSPPSADKLLCC